MNQLRRVSHKTAGLLDAHPSPTKAGDHRNPAAMVAQVAEAYPLEKPVPYSARVLGNHAGDGAASGLQAFHEGTQGRHEGRRELSVAL